MPRIRSATRGLAGLAAFALAMLALAGVTATARAQDIEPRAYSNAPIGVNFLIVGYVYTQGGLSFDSAIPVTDAKLNTSNAVIGYARVFDFWGKSGKFDAIVPYTRLFGTADYQGEPVDRGVTGLARPAFRLSMNLYGSPALRLREFAAGSRT